MMKPAMCLVRNVGAAAVLVSALLVFLPGNVQAQNSDVGEIINRLERMERDMRALNREVYRADEPSGGDSSASSSGSGAGTPPPAYAARFEQRIAQFESELRDMTGQIEAFNHALRQVETRLDKLISDVDFRLATLEGQARAGTLAAPGAKAGASGAPASVASLPRTAAVEAGPQTGGPITGIKPTPGPQTLGTIPQKDLENGGTSETPVTAAPLEQAAAAPTASASVLPAGTPAEQYGFAVSLLRKAEYEKAADALQAFIKAHPKDKLASNANYWLGETYYVRGDYTQAAKIFLNGYKDDPKGGKAADSLLKLGMSLIGLKNNKDACATFDKLAGDFPDAPDNIKRVLVRERDRAKCG